MRLPSRPDLHPEESLTSHVRRTLRRHGMQPGDLTRWSSSPVDWDRLSVFASRRETRAWANVAGLDPQQTRNATFHRYRQGLPILGEVLDGTSTWRQVARRTWLWIGTTQACLPCLAENPDTWWLAWRLPWTYGCLRHRMLLVTHCPQCERLFTEGHRCPVRRFGTRSWMDTPPDAGPELEEAKAAAHWKTAHRIRRALVGRAPDREHDDAMEPAGYLEALRSLSGLAEHLERALDGSDTRQRRAVAAANRNPADRARFLTFADHLLQLPLTEAAGLLADEIGRVRTDTPLRAWVHDHTRASELADPIVEAALEPHTSIGRRSGLIRLDPHYVPQLFWAEGWTELLTVFRGASLSGRCFASLLLIKTSTSCTWRQAGDMLDIPTDRVRSIVQVGKRGLLDPGRFLELVLGYAHRRTLSVNHRERERSVTGLIAADPTLARLAAALNAPHLNPYFLREKLWTEWAGGHRDFTPHNETPPPQARVALVNQRRRWTTTHQDTLLTWAEETCRVGGTLGRPLRQTQDRRQVFSRAATEEWTP